MPAVYVLWGQFFGCDWQKLEPLGWRKDQRGIRVAHRIEDKGEHGPCRSQGRAVPAQELGCALAGGAVAETRWSAAFQISMLQGPRVPLAWPVWQVLVQEELRLMATPRWRAIQTLDFLAQNQPGAVSRGTGREGKTEEASHGVGVGEQLWEPTLCTSWPSPTSALCLLVWGEGH